MIPKRTAILILTAVFCFFAFFDMMCFELFTKRCICDYSPEMQARSVELSVYLPFEEPTKAASLEHPASLQLSDGDLPILDSAAALYPINAAFVKAVYPEGSCSYDGISQFLPESSLQMNNTPTAYKKIVDGDTDIALLAEPSEAQKQYAAEKGVTLEFLPIGKEAFVFLVNANNPVENLNVADVQAIYSGEVTNWSAFGGKNEHIAALQRNEGSGSQSAIIRFMDGKPIHKDYLTFLGSAIGFSFRFYVDGMVADSGVKMLSLNGIYPSKENVSNETYPIVNHFYAVYRADNTNPNVKKLLDWMCTTEAQDLVELSGYSRAYE